MRKVIFTMFFLVVSIVFSENFSNYTEVSEPEYMLIYEVNNLLKGGDLAVDPVGPAEDGKYKVVDENLITYLTIEKSSFNGKIYLFDRKTNKWVLIDNNKTYTLGTNSYIAAGKDGYTTFGKITSDPGRGGTDTYLGDAKAFIDYLKAKKELARPASSNVKFKY